MIEIIWKHLILFLGNFFTSCSVKLFYDTFLCYIFDIVYLTNVFLFLVLTILLNIFVALYSLCNSKSKKSWVFFFKQRIFFF